jgi:hypothetical protein
MKILSILILHNAAEILPFHFRHYDQFVDEYWVFDDHSTDGTLELLKANPRVKLLEYTQKEGLYEEVNQFLIYDTYPKAVGKFGWVMVPDPDEFLVPQPPFDLFTSLIVADATHREVIQTKGFNLVGPKFPKDDGKSQIYELNPMGVSAPIYSKPIVFRPEATVRWMRGKHQLENCNPSVTPVPMLKLIHARYFGADYTRERNAKNYERCGLLDNDKGPAWSCSPEYDGQHLEGSPKWAEWAQTQAFNVLEAPL